MGDFDGRLCHRRHRRAGEQRRLTRSSGDPEYGLLPASTKFERDWIAYEAEAQAAHEEQAQAHVAPAEEQEREPMSTLPKPASTLPVISHSLPS